MAQSATRVILAAAVAPKSVSLGAVPEGRPTFAAVANPVPLSRIDGAGGPVRRLTARK
jgi:hypothetical protein